MAFLNGFGAGLGGAFSSGSGAGSGTPEGCTMIEDIIGVASGNLVGLASGGSEDGKGIDKKEVADDKDDDDDEVGILMMIWCASCITTR